MKTRFIKVDMLLAVWDAAVATTMFPDDMRREMRPDETLESWGDSLPEMREQYRAKVDEFIEAVLDADSVAEHRKNLRALDPTVRALYCDRLNAATYAIQEASRDKVAVEIQASWTTFVAQTLFQTLPQ